MSTRIQTTSGISGLGETFSRWLMRMQEYARKRPLNRLSYEQALDIENIIRQEASVYVEQRGRSESAQIEYENLILAGRVAELIDRAQQGYFIEAHPNRSYGGGSGSDIVPATEARLR